MSTTENSEQGRPLAVPLERPVGRTEPERADIAVLAAQVDSLRAALVKVLDTREKEAKAWFAYETARDNYTGGAALESRRHQAMMRAASSAEKEARLLLATLKTHNVEVTGKPPRGAAGAR